jgi:hypothetical protein
MKERFQPGRIDIQQSQVYAMGGQFTRQGGTQSAGSTGYYGKAIFERQSSSYLFIQ